MLNLKAKEPEPLKPLSFMKKFRNRFKYDIKKMETIAGKYNLKNHIVLTQNALMKAVIYCAVTLKTQGHTEIMGFLAGKYEEGKIIIVDSYIGDCKSSAAYTELDPLETIKMVKKAKSEGLKIVGQWHFHPGMSTTPSPTDHDFMYNLERMGVKTPVQLICNMDDFNLSIMENGARRKAEFYIPPKLDNDLRINLGYINGEHENPFCDFDLLCDPGEIMGTKKLIIAFYGFIGNMTLSTLTKLPFLSILKKWVGER
jgi:proteasome lid subunit RPN8/RPN11